MHCLNIDTHGKRYDQITAIDEYSRKRYCQIVDDKSVTHTSNFLLALEENLGIKIQTIQTDNGREFTNDPDVSTRQTRFEEYLASLHIKHKKTRPYPPWQNGIVERSHREDNERFYNRRQFSSIETLKKAHQRYVNRGNNIHRKVLGFKSPNEIVASYFDKVVA